MSQDDLLNLFPDHIRALIQKERAWDDGDTWVIGDQLHAEFSNRKKAFVLRRNGVEIGTVSLNAVLRKPTKKE